MARRRCQDVVVLREPHVYRPKHLTGRSFGPTRRVGWRQLLLSNERLQTGDGVCVVIGGDDDAINPSSSPPIDCTAHRGGSPTLGFQAPRVTDITFARASIGSLVFICL